MTFARGGAGVVKLSTVNSFIEYIEITPPPPLRVAKSVGFKYNFGEG